MADLLKRSLAPISDAGWAEIDNLAKLRLSSHLSARSIADFDGPLGWDHSAVSTGRLITGGKKGAKGGVAWGVRQVLPLVEAKVSFEVDRQELESLLRGAKDADLDSLEDAARTIATFEENAVYLGLSDADIKGIIPAASNKAIDLALDPTGYPKSVSAALHALQLQGVNGPYTLVVGTKAHQALNQVAPSGYPLRQVIEQITGANILWSPALDGGVLVSSRGGDFEMTVGQDLAIGYEGHTEKSVSLFFIETFTFRVLEPRAIVVLKPKK